MVNFVGAGCGAPDLITVRGARLLEQAEVIIYAGSLVNPELLNYAAKNCEIYNSAYMNLDEVISVMVKAESEGKSVVRLHTGDTSIYSAVREQADCLEQFGIEYSICPGVSSFCGAAASLKSEYTLPDVSQTVIITRMQGRTAVPDKEQIASLAAHKATMIIFLSVSMAEKLSEELIKGGYNENTPAAIVYKASWEDEIICRCTVKTLAESAYDNNIKKTALIIVGDFLGDNYSLSKLYDKSFETEYRRAEA